MYIWKKAVTFITLMLSLCGFKSTFATAATSEESNRILAQSYPYGDKRLPYAKVRTKQGDPLNVRSRPNGRIIGKIPDGWAVVTVRKDSTGKWVRITTHYGDVSEFEDINYASAPSFRTGWVSADYLKQLGRFCEKPVSFMRSNMNGLFANKQVMINEDWLEIGDRISKSIAKN